MSTTRDPITGQLFDAGAARATLATRLAGERNTDSDSIDYQVMREECNKTVCDGTSAVTIGGGAVGDTHLMKIIILKDAGPATATVAGFLKKNNSGTEAAATIVYSGSTADDREIDLKGALNDGAALTVTGSVDEKVIVLWRPA